MRSAGNRFVDHHETREDERAEAMGQPACALLVFERVQEIGERRRDYNEVRPHSSLGNLTPAEFTKMRQEQWEPRAANAF